MRPGHFCPGNTNKVRTPCPMLPGFNEAGAFLPRKRRAKELAWTRIASFNEAGAFLPRKHARGGKDGEGTDGLQ